MERHIVRTYIYPALVNPPPGLCFQDQFAFRPTGSTSGALIALLHNISTLLAEQPYVRVFALDFSKAFDTVRHSTLLDKLARLDIPDEAFNWIKNFLEGHSHCTKYVGLVSTLINISASVIQGSAIGPASYVVVASDLRPVTQGNLLFKFADDTYLVVPSVNTGTCEEEIAHVRDWACANNLTLNQSKSQELLVITPGVRGAGTRLNPPPTIPSIERVKGLLVLGVVVNDRLSTENHVTKIIAGSSKALYALRVLRTHGMTTPALQIVFQATVLTKILYCSPAWSGFCRAADIARMEAFLRRSKRGGYCAENTPDIIKLFKDADCSLLKRILANPQHTLHYLLPPLNNHPYSLRPRPHNHQLPEKRTALVAANFFNRTLYFH